jgi:hypothetical protein
MIRRTLAIIFVLACSLALGAALGNTGQKPHTTSYEVAPMPPTEHIEWEQFAVGGYKLIATTPEQAGPDSGKFRFIIIPEGTMLLVPHWVHGMSDEDRGRLF